MRIRAVCRPGDGFLIQVFDRFGPPSQILVVGARFFEIVDIAEVVDPATLMQALVNSGARVEITPQNSLEVIADQLLHDFSRPRVVIFVIPDLRSAHTPNIAVDPVFPPSRFLRGFFSSAAGFFLLAFTKPAFGVFSFSRSAMPVCASCSCSCVWCNCSCVCRKSSVTSCSRSKASFSYTVNEAIVSSAIML